MNAQRMRSLLCTTVMAVRSCNRVLRAPSQVVDPLFLFMRIGASVAKYAGKNVFKRLTGEQSYRDGNYHEALKRAFLGTDEDILKSDACHIESTFSY